MPYVLGFMGTGERPVSKKGEWAQGDIGRWLLFLTDPRVKVRPGSGEGQFLEAHLSQCEDL